MDSLYLTFASVSLCVLRQKSGDRRLSYYKNKNLIFIIGQIGAIYREKEGIKSQKILSIGIDIIQADLLSRNIPVTKSQIRRLMRPNYKKKHIVKFPFQTVEILNSVYNLIHMQKHSTELVAICKNWKGIKCKRCKQVNMLCRDFLIGELYSCLNILRGSLVEKSNANDILSHLDVWDKNCKLNI